MQKESLKLCTDVLLSILAYDKLNKDELEALKQEISALQNIPLEDKVELMLNSYHFFNQEDYRDNIDTLAKRKYTREYIRKLERCKDEY